MDRTRPEAGWRATALAVALLAITFNFLQPLAHAALMRNGAPGALWAGFCDSTAANPHGKPGPVPAGPADHECCWGLAHAPALLAPSESFIALPATSIAAAPLLPLGQPTPVGIRDGPTSPRGPPSFV